MARRTLVTGGAGFVGSHLIDRLMEAGEEVVCLDNFFTGRKVNVERWLGSSRFHLVRHDVIHPFNVECDRIWHLACPASPLQYQADPIRTAQTCFLGTYNALRLAQRTGARFFLASTSEVYGDPLLHPQPESYRGNVSPTGPRACYDEGKRIAETLCFDFRRAHGVDVRVARIFNTYGPRMLPDDGRVVSNFIVQALLGKPLTLYGDGSQTRSFCYVDDLVEGFLRLMDSSHSGPMNLGNPDEFTIQQLAEIVRDRIAPHLAILRHPLPPDDPIQRKPVIDAAREHLGWVPKVSLRQGLESTIEYFRNAIASRGELV